MTQSCSKTINFFKKYITKLAKNPSHTSSPYKNANPVHKAVQPTPLTSSHQSTNCVKWPHSKNCKQAKFKTVLSIFIHQPNGKKSWWILQKKSFTKLIKSEESHLLRKAFSAKSEKASWCNMKRQSISKHQQSRASV